MKRFINFFICIVLFVAMPVTSLCQNDQAKIKYVFYIIGDGMGINQILGTEQYNTSTESGPEEVNFFNFPVRTIITTRSSSSLVTDSAAAGTTLASGVKTYEGAIGVGVDGLPVPSLTELAKASGKGTGVITSVGINHATPGSFLAHAKSRGNYEEIILDYIASPADFVAGAGFITERKSGHKASYFEQKARDAGIKVYHGKGEWSKMSASDEYVLCLSGKAEAELPYAIDRMEDDTTLPEFVSAGISYLESRFAEDGFFMMVEGGKIDYAGHADDGATCFQEINDLAAAVDHILDFYERYPEETLIVVTADHETGGLMLGAGLYEMHPDRMKAQKMSANALTRLFNTTFSKGNKPVWEDAKGFLRDHLGLWGNVDVDKETEQELKAIFDRNYGSSDAKEESVVNLYSSNSLFIQRAIGYLNNTAGYYWSYTSHSGSPVGVFAKGQGAEKFISVRDNTDIAPMISELAGYKR